VIAERIERRAALHAALGEPVRLAMVEELVVTDRSPKELGERFALAGNLLAHHLDVLERNGLIERSISTGDRRRRYVRLVPAALADLGAATVKPVGRVLFVCTHNSARSQLAAALWRVRTGGEADSAGTHPADAVHPGAVAAARRADLDLTGSVPQHLRDVPAADLVVTVCDRAHEALSFDGSWWHWSIPDPAAVGTAPAFDAALGHLDTRIRNVTEDTAP
jgi:protein-tyrosine-phosphatase